MCKILFLLISLLYASICFEHYVLIIRKSKLYYTASGIVTHVGDRPDPKIYFHIKGTLFGVGSY